MENHMNGSGDHNFHHQPDGHHYQQQQQMGGASVAVKSPPRPKKLPTAEDVTTVDCNPCCRRLGFPRLCTRKIWLVKDICGLTCAIFTWLLLLYAEYVVMVVILLPQFFLPYNFINAVIYNFLAGLALASHLRAMLSDPGAVPRGNATRDNILKLGLKDGDIVYKCPRCVCIKPDRAHHCSICQRCIRKMDHHCPWVNNCVGETNQKYFILFTMYICFISCHAMYLVIMHFAYCIGQGNEWKTCSGYAPPATSVFLIFLIFEALLFGIFTAIMFGTQLASVCTDETGIEQLKKEEPKWGKKSCWLSLKSVFGHPFSWRWFSPFATPRFAYSQSHLHTV